MPGALAAALMVSFVMTCAGQNSSPKPAEALYLELGQAGLDPARVYQVRGASLDRSAVHITLEDGTIGFTQDVMGKILHVFSSMILLTC